MLSITRKPIFALSTVLGMMIVLSCAQYRDSQRDMRPERGFRKKVYTMTVTAYSDDPKSTGWKRNWLGKPVYAYGPNKGKPKKVGITATGVKAIKGTIAADTRYFPFGTIMYVPGYGYGRVEDVGGAIKGYHIDVFFPSRKTALEWGKQRLRVSVWERP